MKASAECKLDKHSKNFKINFKAGPLLHFQTGLKKNTLNTTKICCKIILPRIGKVCSQCECLDVASCFRVGKTSSRTPARCIGRVVLLGKCALLLGTIKRSPDEVCVTFGENFINIIL